MLTLFGIVPGQAVTPGSVSDSIPPAADALMS